MIKVLLAEDQALLRGTLAEVLARDPDIEIVGECSRGDEVLSTARTSEPDVAVLDIDMPGLDGLAAAQLLSEQLPDVRVLILTVFARPGYLRRAMANGALGFLLKDTPPNELVEAIKRTAQGERVVDANLAVIAVSRGDSPLSARETEVLALTCTIDSTSELATQLHLSEGTVRNMLSSAMTKLGAQSRTQAARIAEENGWL
jgi:two-component system response regulator DesR